MLRTALELNLVAHSSIWAAEGGSVRAVGVRKVPGADLSSAPSSSW